MNMEQKLSSSHYYFSSVLFFLLAWKMADIGESQGAMWTIASAMIALVGLLLGIEGVTSAIPRPSPFHGRAGRLLWALRPRGWLVAWGMIYLLASTYGAPHVLFRYQAGGSSQGCIYVGLQGVVTTPADGDGHFNGCRLIKAIRRADNAGRR
jgi:hypothetical protein